MRRKLGNGIAGPSAYGDWSPAGDNRRDNGKQVWHTPPQPPSSEAEVRTLPLYWREGACACAQPSRRRRPPQQTRLSKNGALNV